MELRDLTEAEKVKLLEQRELEIIKKLKGDLFNNNHENLYDLFHYVLDERKYTPRDYKNDFLLKSVSNPMKRNLKFLEFLKQMQFVLYKTIRAVDYLKNYKNYTVAKDYKLTK